MPPEIKKPPTVLDLYLRAILLPFGIVILGFMTFKIRTLLPFLRELQDPMVLKGKFMALTHSSKLSPDLMILVRDYDLAHGLAEPFVKLGLCFFTLALLALVAMLMNTIMQIRARKNPSGHNGSDTLAVEV